MSIRAGWQSLWQAWRQWRTLRWVIIAGAAFATAIALVLMFLLAQATGNREVYERNFTRLLVVNMVVGIILLAVIIWVIWRIWQRLRGGRFGGRLLMKLAATFVLVASVPGALIYLVSYQFVTRSIESWFDVRVESALEAGLRLGRSMLDMYAKEAGLQTKYAARQIQKEGLSALTADAVVQRLREERSLDQVSLWTQDGQHIATANSKLLLPSNLPPATAMAGDLKDEQVVTVIEGLDELTDAMTQSAAEAAVQKAANARVVSYVAVKAGGQVLQPEAWILQVTQIIPAELIKNALEVQNANREYQERSLMRSGMRNMFIGTLTLTMILAFLGALLLAAFLAAQIIRPLLLLAEGVRQVTEGDLRPKAIYQGNDELGGLTQSFAVMTQQLSDARQALTSSVAELDSSRNELQTILDNLSTGVLVLGSDGTVYSANPGACRILGVDAINLAGSRLEDLPNLEETGHLVQQQFASMGDASDHAEPHATVLGVDDERFTTQTTETFWQHTHELYHQGGESLQQDSKTVVLRGALLHDAASQANRLVVLEDVSAIISAQRAQAWGEVARRLAHEIKNPLTPIQLSAERLEMKLMDSLPAAQQAVLAKSVRTIVEQVDAMKRLVNEFRDYARLPAAQLEPVAINALITDVLQLYGEENAHVPIKAELDPQCGAILADAQQLRQVLHNLMQNAQDAQEQIGRLDQPVVVQTLWRPASQRVRLSVLDNGAGFPEPILQRALEPYVTTKAKGTGLGLAVVKKIADEHGATLTLANREQGGEVIGAQVSLVFNALEAHS